MPTRTWLLSALVLGCMSLAAACDADKGTPAPDEISHSPTATDAHVGFRATVQQQRLDVGTRRIGLELIADNKTTVHVNAVQLMTEAFEQRPSTPKDTEFAPGRIIDLVVLYGDPSCRPDVSPEDATVRVQYDTDGTAGSLTLPVDKHGVGVLTALRSSYCAQQRLLKAAPLTYELPFHRATVDGTTVLVGNLLLRRPPDGGSGRPVVVRSLLGSVILDVLPVRSQADAWGSLPRAQAAARMPIEMRAGRTCTAHGRSGTQQPFIFSAYVQVGSAPLYRQIIEPPKSLQRQALAYLDDVCG